MSGTRDADGYVRPRPMQDISFGRKLRNRIGLVLFNTLVTHIPSHHVRLGFLRAFGSRIGSGSTIMRGTTVLDPDGLVIGEHVVIGMRCLLDARGGITVGDNVVIASDVHLIGGSHDYNDPAFQPIVQPVVVEDYVWIASRATIVGGSHLGRGAVVAACALVHGRVEPLAVVGGVPAKVLGRRDPDALRYNPAYRPLFY